MAKRRIELEIVGDASSVQRAFRQTETGAKRLQVGLGTIVKSAFVFGAVTKGLDLVGSAIRTAAEEFSEAQTVAAQTNAVLKSTGGIANVTARQVGNLAGNISKLSGIDDEAIQKGENLLLTFKNVRNELGKGNAIFDRATKAAVDLSVAGFGSIDTTAKQLGKALNDPIKGMTALGRAGVTFTQSQKDQIKALVESNRVLDAQKLILREVESQVGGSAKALGQTLPGALSRIRESFKNALGGLAGAVAEPLARAAAEVAAFVPKIEEGVARLSAAVGPALTGFVNAFLDKLPELQRVGGSVLEPLREHILPVAREVAQVVGRMWASVLDAFERNRGRITAILSNLGETLRNLFAVARPTIVLLFQKLIPAALAVTIPLMEKLSQVVRVLSEVFVKTVSTIVRALDTFLGAITKVTDAASHLPGVGDKFAGISDKVNAAREELRGFADGLDAINGKDVIVGIRFDVEGAGGQPTFGIAPFIKPETDKAAEGAVKGRTESAKRVGAAAKQGTTAAKDARTAAEKQRDAFDDLIAAISLRVDVAASTKSFADDLRENTRLQDAIRAQIKVEGNTTELATQLFQAKQARNQILTDQAQKVQAAQRKTAAALQASQFRALGLTSTGEVKIPTIDNLKKQLAQLTERLGPDVAPKIKAQLTRIGKVLSDPFSKATEETRRTIQGMFQDIRSTFEKGVDDTTSTINGKGATRFRDVLQGLGLSQDQVRRIDTRVLALSKTGRVPVSATTGFRASPTADRLAGQLAGGQTIQVNSTLTMDGAVVARGVTRHQVSTKRRNPPQKRGPNSGV